MYRLFYKLTTNEKLQKTIIFRLNSMISIKLKLVLKGIFLELFLWACALGGLNNIDIQVKKSKTPMILEMYVLFMIN